MASARAQIQLKVMRTAACHVIAESAFNAAAKSLRPGFDMHAGRWQQHRATGACQSCSDTSGRLTSGTCCQVLRPRVGVNSHDAAEDIVQRQRPKAAAVDSSGRRQLLVVRQHPAVAVGYLEVEPLTLKPSW